MAKNRERKSNADKSKSGAKGENTEGRPTKYDEKHVEQAYQLTLLGLTEVEIAGVFGVVESTIDNWKIKYPEFLGALQRGKQIADGEVAQSFRKRAVGYEYTETHVEKRHGEVVSTKTILKEVPPDAGAAMNWLSNRQPKRWRKTQHIEIDDYSEQTKEDLIGEIKDKLRKSTARD